MWSAIPVASLGKIENFSRGSGAGRYPVPSLIAADSHGTLKAYKPPADNHGSTTLSKHTNLLNC